MDINHKLDDDVTRLTGLGITSALRVAESLINTSGAFCERAVRATALRSAIYHKGGEEGSSLDEIFNCADIFTEYIMTGRKPNA